ncbi:hypothetical protein WDU94_010075, partial [Cyamophila willieti]
ETRTPPSGCETEFKYSKQKFTSNSNCSNFSASIQDLKSIPPTFHTNSLPRKMGQFPSYGYDTSKFSFLFISRFYDINAGHFQRSVPMRNSIAGTTSGYYATGGHFGEFGPSDISRDQPTTFVEYFIPRSMSDFNLSIIKPEPVVEGQVLQPVLKNNKSGAKSGGENNKMRVTFQDDRTLGDEIPPPPPPAADEFM